MFGVCQRYHFSWKKNSLLLLWVITLDYVWYSENFEVEIKIVYNIVEINLKQKLVYFTLIMELNILMNDWGIFLKKKKSNINLHVVILLNKNGIAERKNKRLLEVAYFIMFSMHIPNYL